MTRVSITQGLLQNAADRLGFKGLKPQTMGLQSSAATGLSSSVPSDPVSNAINNALNPTSESHANSAARIRLQVQKAADYEALEAPKIWLR
jgi:hypothetical protein